MRRNPVNSELIMAKKYILLIRKNMNTSTKQKIVCNYCGTITTKINIHRHMKLVHYVNDKKAREIKSKALLNYKNKYSNITLEQLILILRDAYQKKLHDRINIEKKQKDNQTTCCICKDRMHSRSLLRHTRRKHEYFLFRCSTIECNVCKKVTKVCFSICLKSIWIITVS